MGNNVELAFVLYISASLLSIAPPPVSPPDEDFDNEPIRHRVCARFVGLRHDVPGSSRRALGIGSTGKLRVGINVQNFLLVNKERVGGEYSGIAVDLGGELGRRLGVPVEIVAFDTAGKLADAVKPAPGTWPSSATSPRARAKSPSARRIWRSRRATWFRRARRSARSRRWTARACASRSAGKAPTTCISRETCSARSSSARRPSMLPTSSSSATSSKCSPG